MVTRSIPCCFLTKVNRGALTHKCTVADPAARCRYGNNDLYMPATAYTYDANGANGSAGGTTGYVDVAAEGGGYGAESFEHAGVGGDVTGSTAVDYGYGEFSGGEGAGYMDVTGASDTDADV
jgi:hypothetical protein